MARSAAPERSRSRYAAAVAPRAALYLMPSLAVLATAVLVLGPGRERPAVGVRIWGVPAEGANVAAWRLLTVERQFGADRAIPVDGMELTVSQAGRRLATWSGASGEDGVAEAVLRPEEPLGGTLDVSVTRGPTALAGGSIALRHPPPVTVEPRPVQGTSRGPIALRVEVARGVLAAPFPGALRVTATRDGAPADGVRVRATLTGAAPATPGSLETTTDANGLAEIAIVPQFHSVDLKLEATDPRADPPGAGASSPALAPSAPAHAPSAPALAPSAPAPAPSEPAPSTSTWEGEIPVRPGALWLAPARPAALVASPVPRDRLYISALGDRGRVFGQLVPLQKNAAGLFEAPLDTSALAALGALALTIAGDPEEQGAGTVTWPLQGTDAVTTAPRVELLLDGVPFAERLEKKRAGTARLAAVGVALVAAVFEAVLLLLYSRASQAQLAAHLARVAEEGDDPAATARIAASPGSRAFSLVVALGLLVLAFGAVAAFALVR